MGRMKWRKALNMCSFSTQTSVTESCICAKLAHIQNIATLLFWRAGKYLFWRGLVWVDLLQSQELRRVPIKDVVFEIENPAADQVLTDIEIERRYWVIIQKSGFHS